MTIGDILAVIALIVLVVSSWGALIVFSTYLAPKQVADARKRLETSVGWCVGRGAILILATVLLVAITAGRTVGPFRLLPFVVAGAAFLLSSVGSAAIVQLLAERMDTLGKSQDCPDVIRTVRATAVYCLAGLFPVGGWFLVAPLAMFATVGAMIGKLPAQRQILSPLDLSRPESINIAHN